MVWYLIIGLFNGPEMIPIPYATETACWEAYELVSYRDVYWTDKRDKLSDVGVPLGFACVPAPKGK